MNKILPVCFGNAKILVKTLKNSKFEPKIFSEIAATLRLNANKDPFENAFTVLGVICSKSKEPICQRPTCENFVKNLTRVKKIAYNFIKNEALEQVFSSEFCEIFKNAFFTGKSSSISTQILYYRFKESANFLYYTRKNLTIA